MGTSAVSWGERNARKGVQAGNSVLQASRREDRTESLGLGEWGVDTAGLAGPGLGGPPAWGVLLGMVEPLKAWPGLGAGLEAGAA